jgi:hypothetical protein
VVPSNPGREEQKLGLPVKPIDLGGIPLIEPLIHFTLKQPFAFRVNLLADLR